MHEGNAQDIVALLAKRLGDIYGITAAQNASIKLAKSYDGVAVVRCSLKAIDGVLVAMALADPPVVTLDISASIKRLKRRLPAKVNTAGAKINTRG